MSELYIVIPAFEACEQTKRCLDSVRAGATPAVTTIVVDHGPSGLTSAMLRAHYPEVIGIRGSPDLWWAGATNLGIRAALERKARAVMLLNQDCYLPREAIPRLLAAFQGIDQGIIAPQQRDAHGTQKLTNRATTCFLLGFPTISLGEFSPRDGGLRRVPLIMGGRGVVIPASIFEQVGLLDEEHLPHYGSDHDFYLRCRKAGVPLYLLTDTYVDVSCERTTIASRLGQLSARQFLQR